MNKLYDKAEIAIEAAKHPRFREDEMNNYWTNRAVAYAQQYEQSFPFMLAMKEKVESDKPALTPKQVAAILNCARKEGETLNQQKLDNVFSFDSVESTDSETPEVDENSKHFVELQQITAKIAVIEAQIKNAAPTLETIMQELEESNKTEQIMFEEFQKRIAVIREARAKAQSEKYEIEKNLQAIKTELENQRRLYALTLQQIAAEQKFDEVRKQFDELRKGMPWDESILPFQWDDVCFSAAAFLSGKNGVLNANDMGLGKTFESGALESILIPMFIEKYGRHPLSIWLTKKTLRHSTFKELRRWNPERMIIVLDGNQTAREFQLELAVANNALVIANYDMLNTTNIDKYDWDFVFMDEVHKLRGGASSTPTKVFENTRDLCRTAKFIVPLSGSPIQNHPKEMWCYLNIFDPDRFPDVRRFQREFCFGWGEKDDEGNPIVSVDWERIIKVMKDRVIRHSKAECLPELPDKVREFRYVELEGEQKRIYDSLRDEFFFWLDDQKQESLTATSILSRLTRLRQAAIIPASMTISDPITGKQKRVECYDSSKIDEAMEIIEQLLQEGEQLVLWSSQFTEPLHEVQRRVQKDFKVTCEIIDGGTKNPQEVETRFQNGEIRVLCCNSKSAGEGYNFQKSDQWNGGANHAIFLDLWWNPKFNEQCEDRLHRQGQKDAVTIHIIQAENSVDSFIAAKLEEKEEMIDGIMERNELRKGADWKDLLKDML